MKVRVEPHHREHLEKLGLKHIPEHIEGTKHEFDVAYRAWRNSMPEATDEEIYTRALATLCTANHQDDSGQEAPAACDGEEAPSAPMAKADLSEVERYLLIHATQNEMAVRYLKLIASAVPIVLIMLALLAALSLRAHADSKIYVITVQDSSGTKLGSFAAPFTIKCNSNVTCSVSNGVLTVNSSASAGSSTFEVNGTDVTDQTLLNFEDSTCTTVTNASGGEIQVAFTCALPANTTSTAHKFFTAYNSTTGAFTKAQPSSTDLGDFSATAPSTSGKIPIYDSTATNSAGGTGAYVPGDPLVQGTTAEGSAIPNPIVVGGKDASGNNKALVLDSSGRPTVNVNGTVPVSGTFWQATQPVSGTFWQTTQPVSIATMPTTPVTGTFWQATQPVSAVSLPLPAGAATAANQTADPCGPSNAKSYAFYDASTNGATQLVALSSGKTIYVCSYGFWSSSSTANTVKLVYGTGTNCATGQTAISPSVVLQAAASTGPIGKVNPNSSGLATAASNALCVLTNAAQSAQAEVSYVQQ